MSGLAWASVTISTVQAQLQIKLTRLDAWRLATLEQVQPAKSIENAESVLAARVRKYVDGLAQHVYSHIDLLVLGVGHRNFYPCRRQTFFVFENGAKLGRVVLDVVVERNLHIELASLIVGNGDGDSAGHVRISRRGKHVACAIDAVRTVGVDGSHGKRANGRGRLGDPVQGDVDGVVDVETEKMDASAT